LDASKKHLEELPGLGKQRISRFDISASGPVGPKYIVTSTWIG